MHEKEKEEEKMMKTGRKREGGKEGGREEGEGGGERRGSGVELRRRSGPSPTRVRTPSRQKYISENQRANDEEENMRTQGRRRRRWK